jgi:Fur family transcriptional regulator, ferric uptake regulator
MATTTTFKALLRKSGYKATPSRLAVLALLEKNRKPMSAQKIIDGIGSAMDQATVYRILKDLKSKGIIRQVDLRHNHAHYELSNADDHHHLVCIRCGTIEDVHDCGIEEVQGTILRRSKNFEEINQHALEFYGICKACAKKGLL